MIQLRGSTSLQCAGATTEQLGWAARIDSLIHLAHITGHDLYAYWLKGLLTRLPTQPASESEQLLQHQWRRVPARLTQGEFAARLQSSDTSLWRAFSPKGIRNHQTATGCYWLREGTG